MKLGYSGNRKNTVLSMKFSLKLHHLILLLRKFVCGN